jgi:hypothetical protein
MPVKGLIHYALDVPDHPSGSQLLWSRGEQGHRLAVA